MWRLKQFMPKEQSGLEGRTIDIDNLKVHVRNVIAEGGFSCVYLARDAFQSSKQYGLKHIICNDKESLDLVTKEISVMKLLCGHPNVVKLLAYSIMDMGRTKEALLVMEFCEKSLVNVLESRGSGYFEGKQILSIFRDVCNAVFAMHSQSPPIAHRDLKAENLLLGPDGVWKLCDFGSTSTNHKRFESPEEMGIEEDNIRKHTTPAYRAPEMWDLFRRDVISEKVDIWALGCLLFRICYFKSAFDGESKLQVLNGNYRIPELPKYSSSITNLVRDMLQASPDARPDITQVWFRVNEQLPVELQKSLPDRPPNMHDEGIPNPTHKAANPPMPRRSPPPPPSSRENARNISPPSLTSKSSGDVGSMGAFWSSHHVKDLHIAESEGGPIFDDEATTRSALKHDRESPGFNRNLKNPSPPKEQNTRAHTKDFEINFFSEGANHGPEKTKSSQLFNTFVAEFDTSKLNSSNSNEKSEREEVLEAEVDILKEQLKQVNSEKAEVTSKYEKLSAICRSQRQEIQELKQALNAKTLLPNKDASNQQTSSGILQSSTAPQREKIEGSVMELQQGLFSKNSPSSDSKKWQAFAEEPKFQPQSRSSVGKSVRTTNGHQNKEASPVSSSLENPWGFGTDNFTAVPGSSQISTSQGQGSNSQRFSDGKSAASKKASQPAGWAGF